MLSGLCCGSVLPGSARALGAGLGEGLPPSCRERAAGWPGLAHRGGGDVPKEQTLRFYYRFCTFEKMFLITLTNNAVSLNSGVSFPVSWTGPKQYAAGCVCRASGPRWHLGGIPGRAARQSSAEMALVAEASEREWKPEEGDPRGSSWLKSPQVETVRRPLEAARLAAAWLFFRLAFLPWQSVWLRGRALSHAAQRHSLQARHLLFILH